MTRTNDRQGQQQAPQAPTDRASRIVEDGREYERMSWELADLIHAAQHAYDAWADLDAYTTKIPRGGEQLAEYGAALAVLARAWETWQAVEALAAPGLDALAAELAAEDASASESAASASQREAHGDE